MRQMDIMNKEEKNATDIFLYREGLFWKAYERSAFLFSRHIRPYQAQKRYVKCLGRTVVSLGFPDKALKDILAGREYEKMNEKSIRIIGYPSMDPAEYERWEVGIAVREVKEGAGPCNQSGISEGSDVLLRLREFQVAVSTPMQCMMFLSELQQSLR